LALLGLYLQLFPKSFTTTCILQKEELQKALTLTTYFTENYSQVTCVFAKNSLTVHSKNEHIGQVTNTINTEQQGDDIEANYNNRYFLDVFSHTKGKQLSFSFTISTRPVFITSTEDISFTYLLMPLTR
jgi:DNA polymerase-3 subunit beta